MEEEEKIPQRAGQMPPPIDSSLAGNSPTPTLPGEGGRTAASEEVRGKSSPTPALPSEGGRTATTGTTVKVPYFTPPFVPHNASKGQIANPVEANLSPTISKPTSDLIGYDQQLRMLDEARRQYTPETEDERKTRERKEKSHRVISAVSDGIRALSNLYFTSQYAPNMYSQENSMLKDTDARQEKLRAEREANRDKYLNLSLKMGDVLNQRANTLRGLEAQAEKIRLAREDAKRKADKDAEAAALGRDKLAHQQQKDAADGKRKDDELARKKKADDEKARHNRAQEDIGARNAANSGKGSGKNSTHSIRMNNNEVIEFSNDKKGAVQGLYSSMVIQAKKAVDHWKTIRDDAKKRGDTERVKQAQLQYDYYNNIASKTAAAHASTDQFDFVKQNLYNFPSLDKQAREILGRDTASNSGGLGWGINNDNDDDNETDW